VKTSIERFSDYPFTMGGSSREWEVRNSLTGFTLHGVGWGVGWCECYNHAFKASLRGAGNLLRFSSQHKKK